MTNSNKQKIRFYHNQTPFIKCPYDGWEKVPDALIRSGFKKGNDIKTQIETYHKFIEEIQKIKKYKVSDGDQSMYVASVLALYKLNQLDPDDPESPLWISPTRKPKTNH